MPAAPAPEPLAQPVTAVAVSSWSALPALPTKKRGRPRKKPSVEALAVAQLSPEHRMIAECRAKSMAPKAIATLIGYNPRSVREILAKPNVKLALQFFAKGLNDKALASKNLAANHLPRALNKVAEEIEKPGTEARHLINAAQMFAKVSGAQGDGGQGDRVQQKVVFNINGDSEAARQLQQTFSTSLDAGEEPADIEWEAVTPEPETAGEPTEDAE